MSLKDTQPPKYSLARKVWEMTGEEVGQLFQQTEEYKQ